MNQKTHEIPGSEGNYLHYLYRLTLFFIILSGFAQMPIFKRYYIADVPGLGWLAQYYVTHLIHYMAAAVLVSLVTYRITEHLLSGRSHLKLSPSGYWRGVVLIGLMATGILMVIKNFQNHIFPGPFIIWLDLTHVSLMVLFLLSLLYSLIFKKKWTISVQ